MPEPWDGVERRVVDERFEKSMADVRSLKSGVADLADAVRIKSDTLHRIMMRIAWLFAAMFVALTVISLILVNGLNRHMDRGHGRIICELNLTPEQKAALGDLACLQTVGGVR